MVLLAHENGKREEDHRYGTVRLVPEVNMEIAMC